MDNDIIAEIKKVYIDKFKNFGIVQIFQNHGLYDHVLEYTNFLDNTYSNVNITQRMWHIMNDNYEIVYDKIFRDEFCVFSRKDFKYKEHPSALLSKSLLERVPKRYKHIKSVSVKGFTPQTTFFDIETIEEFIISNKLLADRLNKGSEINIKLNEIRKTDKLKFNEIIKSIIKNDEYKLISIKNNTCHFQHLDHKFDITKGSLIKRVDAGKIICGICNKKQKSINFKDQTFEGYNIIKSTGGKVIAFHFLCSQEFIIKRESFAFRMKTGTMVCLHCNPLLKQYSHEEIMILDDLLKIYNGNIQCEKYKNKFRHGLYTLDYFLPDIKLGIEYNGNYAHAIPSEYKPEDKIFRRTAQDIWKKDKKKIKKKFSRNSKI